MKKKIYTIATWILISGFVFLAKPIGAAQFAFYPRLETGIMDYTIQYAATSETRLSKPGQTVGYNKANENREYSDTLTFIGTGATFFVNRMFIDLSGQYAFDGSAGTQGALGIYQEDEDDFTFFTSLDYERKTTFDHSDYAISAGYAISKEFSVFAGYKWADSDMHITMNGKMYDLYPEFNAIQTSDAYSETDAEFKYEGPFIGVIHGWQIDTPYFLKGAISAKVALAFLNSKYIGSSITTFIGNYGDYLVTNYHLKDDYKGDSWGLSFGLSWRGMTPIENLSYSLDIGGYRYSFKASNDPGDTLGTINETVLNYKVGIAYAF